MPRKTRKRKSSNIKPTMPPGSPAKPSTSNMRRVSDRINVLRASLMTNDDVISNSTNILAQTLETAKVEPEINNILDFRISNGIEQYYVSWKCYPTYNETRTTWEAETVLEKVCDEALRKYWVKCLLSYSPDPKDINRKELLTRKLESWAYQPTRPKEYKPHEVSEEAYSPSKKRLRRESSDEDFKYNISTGYGHLDHENHHILSPSKLQYIKLESDCSPKIAKSEDFNHFIGTPHVEIGEVVSRKSDSYLVTWHYTADETAETLGLADEILQSHFSSKPDKHLKVQRQLNRNTPNTIIKSASKENTAESDSDGSCSEASTHPPSLSDTCSGPKEAFAEQDLDEEELTRVDAECQTTIDIDPNACRYCQSKMGARSSSRQKKSKEELTSSSSSSKKMEHEANSKSETENTNEEDDEEMVDIEYEVENIVDYRKAEGTNEDEYYIKWKNYLAQYNTWEPRSNLGNCDKALFTFYTNRVNERRLVEENARKSTKQDGNGGVVAVVKKGVQLPPLPPVPDTVMEVLNKVALVTDGEVEMAYKLSKTVRKDSRWGKNKLKKVLMDLIGEAGSGSGIPTVTPGISSSELPLFRHQILMLEGERRKELIFKDLKKWEIHLNWIAQGKPEIVVENNFDLAGPPVDFKYINDNVIGEGVTFPDDTLEGCDCDAEETCIKDKSHCCPGKHGKVVAYNCFKRLRVPPGYPIYECNKRCKCGPECPNRVVQDGTISLIGTKLCIFRTSNERGWGVKTLKKIKRGSFVCLYAGEIITSDEAENRGNVYENLLGASYLFDLDYYDAGKDTEDSCPYTIDATKMGNISHFINHSCDPNLHVFNVWADCVDQNLPKLAFFALCDINKDEELTYDYSSQDVDETTSSTNPSTSAPSLGRPALLPNGEPDLEAEAEEDMIDPELLATSSPAKNRMKLATVSAVRRACLCGSSNCRKVLF